MSLILKNKQVYDFYQTHPNFDFEKMNILMLDLLNGFSESVYPSLNQTVASKLLDQMTSLQGQLLKQQQEFLQWRHEQDIWKIEIQKDIQKWSEKTLEKVEKTADKESLVEFFEKINDKLSHPPKPPKPH
jgi:hypothetical protein